jgi:triacylglycerol lipase
MPLRILLLIPFLMNCSTSRTPKSDESPAAKEETVVLLHGMGRTRLSMIILSQRFRRAGYQTANFPYNQTGRSLDRISGELIEFIKEKVKTPRYHLVAHSLGNVIIRDAFRKEFPPGLGRIVMLAPPNHPAHLAKRFKNNLLYRWFAGDSGQKLSEEEFYRNLPVPKVEFGVIAGDKGQKITFSEPNDGLVGVEGTKLEGMSDFIVLNHAHTFIMNCKDTFDHCREFLEEGSFQ